MLPAGAGWPPTGAPQAPPLPRASTHPSVSPSGSYRYRLTIAYQHVLQAGRWCFSSPTAGAWVPPLGRRELCCTAHWAQSISLKHRQKKIKAVTFLQEELGKRPFNLGIILWLSWRGDLMQWEGGESASTQLQMVIPHLQHGAGRLALTLARCPRSL